MKHLLPGTFASLAVLSSLPLLAQLEYGGRPYGLDRSMHGLPEPPVAVMPVVDPTPLLAEDEARAAQGIKGPWRFGINHSTCLLYTSPSPRD